MTDPCEFGSCGAAAVASDMSGRLRENAFILSALSGQGKPPGAYVTGRVINADGTPGVREIYATLPASLPDGLTFDADGALLVSCYTPARIWRVPPGGGEPEILLEDWEAHLLSNPTNIVRRGRELFVANLGRWHLTRIVLP